MACNRDEAVRAKEIAEKKMQNNDFEGAQKLALRAQQLLPELENISQLLAVCNVHCAAQSNIYVSEKNWYGILQVERLADEATIKKQYRKLALVLHPDKNKFPGAEAAFKLIGQANTVLSDHGKRTLYDNKCRASVRTTVAKPPPHQVNQNRYTRNQYGVQSNIPSAPNFQFGGLNQHQPGQPNVANVGQAFWTCCPFCNIKYQYYRDFVNKSLRCPKCQKPFTAYDLGAQGGFPGSNSDHPGAKGVPPVPNWSQPPFSQQKQAPYGFPSKKVGHAHVEGNKEGSGLPKVDAAKDKESGTMRNTNRKRGRTMVVESSESCDTETSSESEGVILQENGGNFEAGKNSTSEFNGVHPTRRSSRQRQRVSYNENASDDDIVSPTKRSRESQSSDHDEEEQKEAVNGKHESDNSTAIPVAADMDVKKVKHRGSAPPDGNLPGSTPVTTPVTGNKFSAKGEEDATLVPDAENCTVDDTESSSSSGNHVDPEIYVCPDPEFYDFDKDKEENCFATDQIWACYDTIDGMPRFYAQVRKVFPGGFKLRITWLEADPEDQSERDWVEEGLPIACGEFKRGDTEETSDRLCFSHQIQYKKGRSRGSYVIYPKKGEIWSLFKDWDIGWISDPKNHKKFKFEIVEVISDFVENVGIKVAYLDKVEGFTSLFQQTTREGIVSFLIPHNQLLRFSHRIPTFKMSGTEREGVPIGSFELDPASLSADAF